MKRHPTPFNGNHMISFVSLLLYLRNELIVQEMESGQKVSPGRDATVTVFVIAGMNALLSILSSFSVV